MGRGRVLGGRKGTCRAEEAGETDSRRLGTGAPGVAGEVGRSADRTHLGPRQSPECELLSAD